MGQIANQMLIDVIARLVENHKQKKAQQIQQPRQTGKKEPHPKA